MTAADYIILAVIAALFTFAFVFCIRKKRRGGCGGCSGNCSECGRKNGSDKTL